ncbi:hypothetical protein CVT25_001378 [Psilocybe cyanescens]|uniref:Uncharacterized protein n=1 Tax=Psilocybe cyanescens TaxID=93625 RepID=A0A409X5L6_PSICY|nr:hypothetical protein CVT25_001378 [Psilocybe cyanescens]
MVSIPHHPFVSSVLASLSPPSTLPSPTSPPPKCPSAPSPLPPLSMKCPLPPSKQKLSLKSHTAATAAPPLSPPKLHVSCKWNQLNINKSATKQTKTAAEEEGAEADEGEGKSARGKALSKIHKTLTQQRQEDAADAAMGPPAHLKLVAQKLDRAATSVAPPECPPSFPSPSHCVCASHCCC